MNTPVSIAERITMIRNGQTYAKFAKEINCNINTLRSYERGLANPNLEFIQSICSVKNISTGWLIFGKGLMCSGEDSQCHEDTTETASSAPQALKICARCAKLEAELDLEKQERRELTAELRMVHAENRQWPVKLEQLLRENGELRERCATLTTLLNTFSPDGVFKKVVNIQSSEGSGGA